MRLSVLASPAAVPCRWLLSSQQETVQELEATIYAATLPVNLLGDPVALHM